MSELLDTLFNREILARKEAIGILRSASSINEIGDLDILNVMVETFHQSSFEE